MKHWKTAIAAVALSMTLTVSAVAQSALQQILEAGVLRVGTTGDWAPLTQRDPGTNIYHGFDIDVLTELAKDLGVTIEYVPTDWKSLVQGVVEQQYHITGSATISPPRMKVAGFSESYLAVEYYPFTLPEKAERLDGYDAVNQPGVTVAAALGTNFETLARKWFPNATIKVVEAPGRGYQEVLAGRADVFITSNIEGATLVEKHGVVRVPGAKPRAPMPIAMLLPQADQIWINYVNAWVRVKMAQGFFDDAKAKWGL